MTRRASLETVTAVVETGIRARPDGPVARAEAARALLGWWVLAGVDTAVRARPVPWLDLGEEAPTEAAAPPERANAGSARERPAVPLPPRADRPAEPATRSAWQGLDRFDTLEALHAHVRKLVPNAPLLDGAATSGVLVIGDSPSAADLETGRPFSGPAGQLLDRMLAAIGLDRSCCGITLLTPCRPLPGPASPEDIAADLPLTLAHLRLLRPRRMLLLGATATQALARTDEAISRVRGRPLEVAAEGLRVPALATFNPGYLLRRPEDKALAWADLLAFRRMLG